MSDIRPHDERAALPASPQPILSAHEQVRVQLRAVIIDGGLPHGGRLPNETELAEHFGVSRGTVREALRALASEHLIKTSKGNGGGSYVTLPTVADVSDVLERNVELLTRTANVSLTEFLDARRLIEGFTVRHAARHRTPGDLERLRATLSPADEQLSTEEQYLRNRGFHLVLADICDNALIQIAAQPVFSVLHTHMERSTLSTRFPRRVCAEHEVILDAIDAGDEDRAGRLMDDHLDYLATVYKKIWQPGGAR